MTETRTVGRYEIVQVLGRGGMAVVYLARQTDLDRFIALKELSRVGDAAQDPSFAYRFIRESRLAGSLAHPNIVVVHEYFEDAGTPYIAMEYIPGGSLRPYVGTLTPPQIAGILEGVLAGLAHAEHARVVHRDLKPENLMVTEEGRIKITDFGIARATTSVATRFVTATGTTVGTPAYMAPEQAMGKDIGAWTDLYTTGVIAYELLAGRLPFPQDEAPMAILMRHINEEPSHLRGLCPELSPALADWVMGLLHKEPSARPGAAEPAWHQLEDILIDVMGPRWRREARLPPQPGTGVTPQPLTPAPFDSKRTPTPTPGPVAEPPGEEEAESEFFSYPQGARGEVASPQTGPEDEAGQGAASTGVPPPPEPSPAPTPTLPDQVSDDLGTRDQPTAAPAQAVTTASSRAPRSEEAPAGPADQTRRRRLIGIAGATVVIAVSVGLGFALLGGGEDGSPIPDNDGSTTGGDSGGSGGGDVPGVTWETSRPEGNYEIELPAGWEEVETEVSVGSRGQLRTRRLRPDGKVLIAVAHMPAEGQSPQEFVRREHEDKLTDPGYQLHELEQVQLADGRPASYWEFDLDHEDLGPARAFAYVFEAGGVIYRVQGTAKQDSEADEEAAAVAEHAADTLEPP